VRRHALVFGALAGALAALVLGVNAARHGGDWLFRNDAEFYWLVARDPFANGAVFRPIADEMGNAYRYGRMLFPFLGWLVVGGRDSLVRWGLAGVDAVSFGAVVALAAELCARRGAQVERGLLVLVVPGLWFATVLVLAEPLVLALILAVYLLALDGRPRSAMVAGALLLLAREAAVIALVPLVWRAVRQRRWADVVGWGLTLVPLFAWWTWVRVQVGEWPFLDPSSSRRNALSLPFVGFARVVPDAGSDHVAAFVIGAITVAAAAWAWRRSSRTPVSEGAVLFGLLVLCFGQAAWFRPGEAIRLMAPAQLLTVIALVSPARQPAAAAVVGRRSSSVS
jgi:hypothetical protein